MNEFMEWDEWFLIYKKYIEENNTTLIPKKYVIDGYQLGLWVHIQIICYQLNQLSEEHVNQFNELGVVWDLEEHNK